MALAGSSRGRPETIAVRLDVVEVSLNEYDTFRVIAQEVERIFPDLVKTGEDGIKRVHYYGLIGPLIEAVRELDNRRLRALEGGSTRST